MNRYRISLFLSILLLSFLSACTGNMKSKQQARKLEIKNGAYYINGEKTFINAIGYEIGARPGQHPYKDVKKLELERVKFDLRVIKEAGFNAVRTWAELTEEEVKLIQESGLMLVYGIWVLPDGNFDDPQFVADAEQQVKKVMEWSKNYDCIITYLLMNEPMPAHIFEKGAANTFNLWTDLTAIIHAAHPGIPVTISNNSAVGEYLNENIFDVYGYNAYDYSEGLPGYTQGFSNHFNYLKALNGENKPILVTEFGMSVSPIGWGKMYGGNTRKRQADHVIKDFGELLDSDVSGICPFYYADGWWKAGEPDVHNPLPEEWFGYWGYASRTDTIGYPRPVWYELSRYNRAIVASPRNHKIYQGAVPMEFYLSTEVAHIRVIYNDSLYFDKAVNAKYFTDTIDFGEQGITDRELIFEFYNSRKELLKWESIVLLTTKNALQLPKIDISLNSMDLDKVKNIEAKFTIEGDTIFKMSDQFDYLFSHHIGWEAGDHRSKVIDAGKTGTSFTDTFTVPEKCIVLNVAAGMDIRYGKFTKRIYNQQLVYRGDWADPIRVK
ncbi:MAG: hypothetical protein H6539_05460 [Bacteroidales bacterium]|nr:hypothetical protein [Bacteroidales bacterium]